MFEIAIFTVKTHVMDDIISFFNGFINRYPKSWLKTEDFVLELLKKDYNPINSDSKYVKPHICNFTSDGIKFLPKERANSTELESSTRLFDINLIDYAEVFEDFDRDYFDIEDWCSERLETEIMQVREFLFDCSIFKGTYFIQSLLKELLKMEKEIDDLWNSFTSPNWLQSEIVEGLKTNLIYLREEVLEDFSSIYPNINNIQFTSESIISKTITNTSENIWYKIAELMADGTITITDKGEYLFKEELITVEIKMSRLVSKHLGGTIKPTSIKSYLNMTKSDAQDNKNIFLESRKEDLTIIATRAEKNGKLNDYYRNKLKTLLAI